MKTDLFHTFLWPLLCSKFAGILDAVFSQHHLSNRIKNISTKIPSPPLALFVVMLPKAHLTLHSRLSGSLIYSKRSLMFPIFLFSSISLH